MTPDLILNGRAAVSFQPWLRSRLRSALPHLPKHLLREVVVTLVGDASMSALHLQSHGDPSPTDVLTYEIDHDPRGRITEGQIVVCVPEAKRRVAARFRTPRKPHASDKMAAREEILLYALHGLLHLCGHDDLTKAEFERMHALEDRILENIGVGAVFARDGQPPSVWAEKRPAAPQRRVVSRPSRKPSRRSVR